MAAHASALQVDVETQVAPSPDAGQRRLRMTWFLQGAGLAALMLVAVMGAFLCGSAEPSGHDAAVAGWMGGALPTTRTGGNTAMSPGALTSIPDAAILNGNSWQTGAIDPSPAIPPQMVSPLRAEERASSIKAASKVREAWNLWAAAYTAFVHELAPSQGSIRRWWAELAQELPSREFFESQLNELKAVQAKAAPMRRGGLVTMKEGGDEEAKAAPVEAEAEATPVEAKAEAAPVEAEAKAAPVVTMKTEGEMNLDGLKAQAMALNPVVGYFDPLNLADQAFWDQSNEATIGWLRESEIKHGRIAMFGFVGYIVHANGMRWPWKGPWDNIPTDISPQEMWDMQPAEAKWQIILTIGFFEFWRENINVLREQGQEHYMRGGKPGFYPTFDAIPHPVPFNLFDPFGFSKKKSPEKKAKGLITEINNGRLAMIGLMGFLAESQVPGSVPFLTSVGIKPYAGNIMQPFAVGESFAYNTDWFPSR